MTVNLITTVLCIFCKCRRHAGGIAVRCTALRRGTESLRMMETKPRVTYDSCGPNRSVPLRFTSSISLCKSLTSALP